MNMLRMCLFSAVSAVMLFSVPTSFAQDKTAKLFGGQDLHIEAEKITGYRYDNIYLMHCEGMVSMVIGDNILRGGQAVVQLNILQNPYHGKLQTDYEVTVFLKDNPAYDKGKRFRTVVIETNQTEDPRTITAKFMVTGQVYATAHEKISADVRGSDIYSEARGHIEKIAVEPLGTNIRPEALVPGIDWEKAEDVDQTITVEGGKELTIRDGKIVGPAKTDKAAAAEKQAVDGQRAAPRRASGDIPTLPEPEPTFRYPVNIAGIGAEPPQIESAQTEHGLSAATITGRFYIWQKQREGEPQVELMADNAVIFYAGRQVRLSEEETGQKNLLASGAVRSVYLQGDVQMTEGNRTIRADEMYYDFQRRQGLAINAVMRNFDEQRKIPIYLRASRIRQVAEHKFMAEDVTFTSSEMYKPQIRSTASKITITDLSVVDEEVRKSGEKLYEADIEDIRMWYGETPFFYWPRIKSRLERPDVPIKSIHVSHDNDFGTSVETRWHMARLLGLKEPDGVDSTLALDYFGERGVGAGADIDYRGSDNFGRILAYIIKDSGEDDLGRTADRENLEPPRELRGRFRWQHRHFLPENWQLTFETSYASDKNFIEGFYRSEFNTGKEQETLLHLKRTQDNWGISFLTKVRINDFVSKVEELPTFEYHVVGESLFDALTFYGDARISRLRNRYPEENEGARSEKVYTFYSTKGEIDYPFDIGNIRAVPYVAGAIGYDDQSGFDRSLSRGIVESDRTVNVGEVGFRAATNFWSLYENLRSDFWDVDGIRHIVKPHLEMSFTGSDEEGARMRDVTNFGVLQRFQTKRGPAGDKRIVDWMRLNVTATMVSNRSASQTAPDKNIWNTQISPLFRRRDDSDWGVERNKINVDYEWLITDTTAVLSDMNYDIASGVVGQANIGISRFRYPNLSYYIGSRYLNHFHLNSQGEHGSHALLYSIAYKLNPRYTLTFSQEYNLDYDKSVFSELSLIRRYHRVYYALSLNTDSSIERSGIMFSVWPEGMKELAIGSRKYYGLAGTSSSY